MCGRPMHTPTCLPLTSYTKTEWSSEPTAMLQAFESLVQKAAKTQCLLLACPAYSAETVSGASAQTHTASLKCYIW